LRRYLYVCAAGVDSPCGVDVLVAAVIRSLLTLLRSTVYDLGNDAVVRSQRSLYFAVSDRYAGLRQVSTLSADFDERGSAFIASHHLLSGPLNRCTSIDTELNRNDLSTDPGRCRLAWAPWCTGTLVATERVISPCDAFERPPWPIQATPPTQIPSRARRRQATRSRLPRIRPSSPRPASRPPWSHPGAGHPPSRPTMSTVRSLIGVRQLVSSSRSARDRRAASGELLEASAGEGFGVEAQARALLQEGRRGGRRAKSEVRRCGRG
jgi:hypothetical protein